MEFAFGFKVSGVRCFRGLIQPKPNRLVVDLYFRKPLVIFAAHARKPASVARRRFIPSVFHVANRSQVLPSVIRAVAVNVVDLFWRPTSGHIQPCQPVRQMQRVVDADNDVAVTHSASGFISQTAPPPRFCPSKFAGFRMVAHKFFKPFWRQTHLLVPLLSTVNINCVVGKGQA